LASAEELAELVETILDAPSISLGILTNGFLGETERNVGKRVQYL
jgi:hypothetical protein